MPLAHDMIGLYSAVANANHMAAWGGTDLLLGTNPLAVAIPAGEEAPVVLDIATSVVSYGTIKNHKLQHKPLPEGWMVDAKTGAPITDAARSGEGLLLPMGGYKGSGLAIVLGILAGTLNGAAFGRDVVDFNADDETACNTGQFIIALDVGRFMPLEAFKREVDRHLGDLRSSRRLPGFDAIRLPGEHRRERRADRIANGVPISGELMARLDHVAEALTVRPLRQR
jgi:LDH2 family malate/lactate/ureidoglycolate dehydrogenase